MSNNFHLQLYRGTTAQNNAYTGPAGELTVDTQTNNIRLHDGSTAGGVVIGGMPTGSIIPFGGSTAPDGYLLCDGSAVSRSTYSALFAVIGTTYGPGDGNSTFNLPINQRYLVEKKEPDSSDNRWYNLYSDGWCEQGGQIIGTTSGTLTFLKPYQDTNYTIFMHGVGTYTGSITGNGMFNPKTRTASSCTYHQDSNVNTIMWQACGYTSTNIGKTIIKY